MTDVQEVPDINEINTKDTEQFVSDLRSAFMARYNETKHTDETAETSHRIDNDDITFLYFKSKDRTVTYSDTKDTHGNTDSMVVADQLPDGRIVLLYWRKGSPTIKYVQEQGGQQDEVVNLPGSELTHYISLIAPRIQNET